MPAATVPPATREARPGRAGAELPPSTEIGFLRLFFACRPEISYQRGKMRRPLLESGVPALYLSWSFRVPAIYLGLPFRRSWPSHGGGPLTVAFHPGAACRAGGAVRGVSADWSLQRQRRRRRPGGEDAPEQLGEFGRVDSLACGGEFRQGPPAPLLDVVRAGGRLRVHVLGPHPGQVVLLGLADVPARDLVVLGAGGQVRAEVDVADAEFLAQFADDGLAGGLAGFQ